MNFVAWQKISLVDYPGLISMLLFVKKCNFWCEYCHNKDLQSINTFINENDIFDFIDKKGKKLDALCITGGEPSLYKDQIFEFVKKIKGQFPYLKVKTDTNGSDPSYIKEGKRYFDYVAMDFKSLDYSKFSNTKMEIILQSLNELKKYNDYEVRITVYPTYIKPDDFLGISKILKGVKNVVIQQYRPVNNVKAYENEILEQFCSYFENCSIRA